MHPNKWRQKKGKKTFRRTVNHTVQPQRPVQEEDWEKELEEISQSIEMQKQPPYDSRDVLMTDIKEICHCNIQNDPSSVQGHYSPAVHHIQPVKWVRCVYAIVDEQFADAED